MPKTKISLDDKYALDTTRAYMTGIDALVRLPMLQHQRDLDRGLNTAGFISGYRGSPLGNIDQAMWRAQKYLDKHNIKFQPGINEELAATAVWGSQQVNVFPGAKYDGVFGMWYGKAPGVDRSMDAIKHANAFGTSKYGGVLAIAGDDHACKSSTLPAQTEHNFIGASMPVLSPANVQEVLDLGIFGWELSRYCGAWVALKAITENMDSAISAEIDPRRVNIVLPEDFVMPADGVHARWPDSPLEQEERLNKYKIYAALAFARVNNLNSTVIDSDKARLGIITTGKAYLDVLQALEDMGIDEQKAGKIGLRVFKVGMSWPLEPVSMHAFAEGLEEILVVEEKRSIIQDQVNAQLYNQPVQQRPRVIGEFDEHGKDLLPNTGELTPAMIARAIASRMRRFYADENIENRLDFYNRKEAFLAETKISIERKPHYCSGCPHSTSTRIPEGSRAMGGIGCHYMGTWQEGDRRAETFTQMGGEGVSWVGQAAFTETNHVFQNLGDGTYFHSGLLAIRQAIAADVNITYKILYNDAVAMTGGQPLEGSLTIEQLVMQLRGEGVKRIAVVSDAPEHHRQALAPTNGLSIHHRDQLMMVQTELREVPGTSIFIYEQTCAAEKRRRRKKGTMPDVNRRVFINKDVCEGCGDCSVESNCLSILPLETELGRKRSIDQSACNKDFSCLKGFCPSLVSVVGGSLKKKSAGSEDTSNNFPELPEPTVASIEQQPWNIVVTGIGGTGVLTMASIVAMAAHIDGKGCATLNQTGLAQKFGAVVSHVRVGRTQKDIHAVRIAAGDADLLLGCDLIVASGEEAMAKVNQTRSNAIINIHQSVPAAFVSDPDMVFPAEEMKTCISHEVGRENVSFIDATAIAENLLGDSIASNLFLLGFACQRGLLPVSRSAIEDAIALNAVAIDFNQQAFLWGRRAAVDLASVKAFAQVEQAVAPLTEFAAIVDDRYKRLIDYQSKQYADRYRLQLERLANKERALSSDNDLVLSAAAARNLYKLMAYKDEYEVARLYSTASFKRQLESEFEGKYRLQFHLAPPLLAKKDAHTGLPVKRRFGGWILPLFGVLSKGRKLRGTWLDVFGYNRERRMERELISDYEVLLDEIQRDLSAGNYQDAIELASLPEKIRGYGHVKLQSVQVVSELRASLLAAFRGESVVPVKFHPSAQEF